MSKERRKGKKENATLETKLNIKINKISTVIRNVDNKNMRQLELKTNKVRYAHCER